MPVQRIQYIKPGGSGTDVSSTIVDSQLTILENLLKQDGYLSPADYDTLISRANQLRGGFNTSTQSGKNALASLDAKISDYYTQKQLIDVNKNNDAQSITTSLNDTLKTISLQFGTNPDSYFKNATKALNGTLSYIEGQYKNAQVAGNSQVVSSLEAVYNKVKDQYDNTVAMQNELNTGAVGNFGAFVTTDAQGRVTGIEYKMLDQGNIGGYMKTNAKIGVVPVFANAITQSDGTQVAYIGGQKFDNTPAFTDFKGNEVHNLLISGPDPSKTIDLTPNSLSVRGYIPDNSWAKGASGSWYKNIGNGQFMKYPTLNPSDVGIKPTDYQDVNSIWEDKINRNVIASGDPNQLTPYIPPQSSLMSQPSAPLQTTLAEDKAAQQEASKLIPKNAFSKPVTQKAPSFWQRAKQIFSGGQSSNNPPNEFLQ